MRLIEALMLMSVLAVRPLVFVKGHSRAADEVREKIATFTCYSSGTEQQSSSAILQVDHILAKSGRRWVVMVLQDREQKVLYEKKAEEYPWPLPSSLNGLLKNLAESTCPSYQRPPSRKSAVHQDLKYSQGGKEKTE